MAVAEHAAASTPRQVTRTAAPSSLAVPARGPVYFACVALALTCNYVLGKDMAWDTLNYHLYLGFSALNDRFGQDYFAAGPLAYLNPYAYAPFYAMVRAGLPALAICSILAAVHSVILWLSFELGVAVCASKDGRTRLLAGCCAMVLAFMNPIMMQQIGSCFADITTAELALGAWLLLASAIRVPQKSRVIYAGLVLGAVSALKLSNALSAASAFAMIAFLPLSWRGRVRHGLLYGVSLGIGFAIVAAPWSYRLEQVFGNPMFPMFNNIFRSPQFTTESMGNAYRFIPESFGEALWRPFAMIAPTQMVHEELSAPDPRYAILIVLALLLALRWVWQRLRPASVPEPAHSAEHDDAIRVLTALASGLAINWVLWLRVSGNSRYVLCMACIAAAVVVGVLFRLFESQPKVRNYVLAIIFVTQAVQLYMGAEYRWNGVSWGGQWFDLSMPATLKTKPALYLTLGTQSNSFLAPFLAEGSGVINLSGGYTLDPESINGAHVKALIRRYEPNVRVVFLTDKPSKGGDAQASVAQVDTAVQWFGLRADMSDCPTITVHGLPPDLQVRLQTSLPQEPQDRENTYVAACRLVSEPNDLSALIARRAAVDLVFHRLEDACPSLFQPRRLVSVNYGTTWQRIYGATDIVAWISHGRVRFSDQIRPHGVVDVGSETDWEKSPMRLECGRRDGIYFARLLQADR